MSNYCTIYLVRHGETDWNKKGLIQGHTDIPLNSEGINQAGILKDKLNHITFDEVYSSDLSRSKKTAEIIALEHKLIVQTTKVLRERRYGSFEGKSFKELKKVMAGVEPDKVVTQRLITFLREVSVANPNKKILVVSHGGAMRMVLDQLTGKEYGRGSIDNTAYVEIESDGVDFFIKSMHGIKDL